MLAICGPSTNRCQVPAATGPGASKPAPPTRCQAPLRPRVGMLANLALSLGARLQMIANPVPGTCLRRGLALIGSGLPSAGNSQSYQECHSCQAPLNRGRMLANCCQPGARHQLPSLSRNASESRPLSRCQPGARHLSKTRLDASNLRAKHEPVPGTFATPGRNAGKSRPRAWC
jgi:hypothetical protein